MRSRASEDRGGPGQPAARGPARPGAPGTGTARGPQQAGPQRAHTFGGPRHWRVRTRLLALIAIPTATAVIVSGIRIVSATRSSIAYQRVVALANLGEAVTALAQSVEGERDFTAAYIAQGEPATGKIVLRRAYSATDRAARQVTALAGGVGASYPAQAQARAAALLTGIDGLGNLRTTAIATHLPAPALIDEYAATVDDLLAMDNEIAQGGGDAALAETVRVLGVVSTMKEEASRQRAILDVAFTLGRFAPGALDELIVAAAEERSNLAVFNASATTRQRQEYQDTVSGSPASRAEGREQSAISLVSGGGSLVADPAAADNWYRAMSGKINRMRTVEKSLAGSSAARARSLLRGAITSALAVTVAILLALASALILTAFIARSIAGPLARLRAGALEVAEVRLPEVVRRLSETGGEEVLPDVGPIDVDTTDEIGAVARAFDQVRREALRLVANEAMLRSNVNAMFVSLARRSQSLVERQIKLIDELERDEEDADRLAGLFRMDHLATRMRRNSENLLLLAGHEPPRQSRTPVALIDVLRAALSEIGQFERVSLDVQPGIAVYGLAVNDVVHLVAELAENATSFSPGDRPVRVAGHLLNSGGLLLDISDQGVGMGTEEMAHANWRLDNPPVVDVAVSRQMGLFVVARLAARHGIRVRLRPAPDAGLTALVWLPDELVIKDAGEVLPGVWRFAAAGRAGEKALRTEPETVAERVAAAVAAARAPRFGGSGGSGGSVGRSRGAGSGVFGVGSGADAVIVPSLPSAGKMGRLPIFEAVDSDWFGNARPPARPHTGSDPPGLDARDDPAAGVSWTSPADEGWRAAAAAKDPVAGGPTSAGLPRRIPRANLVPGTAAAGLPHARPAARSADVVAARFAGFQRGVRAGHAAARRRRYGPPVGGAPAGGPPADRAAGEDAES